MALTYVQLQSEIKRRSTRDEGSTQFDTTIKIAINQAIKRLAKEANWKVLRRKTSFNTVTSYTTGSGAATYTDGSASVTVTGATFLTDNVQPGRLISLGGGSDYYEISTITGETTLTLTKNFSGTSAAGDGTYSIYPQETYVLPPQVSDRCFLWHEFYGNPVPMVYVPEQQFKKLGINRNQTGDPTAYHMWGSDWAKEQPKQAGILTLSSTSSADTSVSVTVHGIVGGYPDSETITTNASDGTTTVNGSKSFSFIERVSKEDVSTTGLLTLTADSANTTVAVIPTGRQNVGIHYKKVSIFPLPDEVAPINVFYYKEPYDLVNDNDIHEMGDDFDEAIILLASAKIKAESGQQEASNFYQFYKDELKILKKYNVDKIDWGKQHRRASLMQNGVHPYISYRQVGSGNYGSSGNW